MNEPRTTREALIAELLGDLDRLMTRIESLPPLVESAEYKISCTVTALDEAGDKFRLAVTTFTEQAKTELAEYLNQKTALSLNQMMEDQRTALHEAAHTAILSVASEAELLKPSMFSRLMEHTVTAVIASALTSGLVYMIVQGMH